MECVTTCSSSDCLVECNRAAVTCGDGKYGSYDIYTICIQSYTVCSLRLLQRLIFILVSKIHLACPCHIDCIDGCNGCDNPICFCNVSQNFNSLLSKLEKLVIFQDDTNEDNLDACLSKTSKTLGQCILDCDNDSSCETACVSAFKDEHSECPCQVRRNVKIFIVLFCRKNVHLVALVTTMIATCPKRKRF